MSAVNATFIIFMFSLLTDARVCRVQKANGPEQKWEKFKYGEWYLPPKTWKKRLANEPLRDPEELKKEDTSEAKKKSNQLV